MVIQYSYCFKRAVWGNYCIEVSALFQSWGGVRYHNAMVVCKESNEESCTDEDLRVSDPSSV